MTLTTILESQNYLSSILISDLEVGKHFYWEINGYSLHGQVFLISWLVILLILIASFLGTSNLTEVPRNWQNFMEFLVEYIESIAKNQIGKNFSEWVPFVGTLFIYILFMNLSGLIPFMKASTASWSTTMALALCVFFYVQYIAIKELGFLGYLDHLAGKQRGVLAFTVIMPLFMLILHLLTELIRPVSLSLRLRGNIWGDEVLITLLAGFGIKGLPLLIFNMLMGVLASVVQAAVFCMLTTIYLALVLSHEEEAA